jgi:LysM repeat protein
MKMPTLIRRKKLRAATAARRSRAGLPEIDYEEMGEPNMKLSRALLIVLVLHVVAVAGIIAFNTIKTREAVNVAVVDPIAPSLSSANSATTETATNPPNELTQVAVKTETKIPEQTVELAKKAGPAEDALPSKASTKSAMIADSGKLYTVVRGDNPVTIARRFHVSYDALLELNQISDPRKLRIGTKLHIPEREETNRHKSD